MLDTKTRRRTNKKSNGQKPTKESILDAAEIVFAEKGFHGATVRDIFDKAGINYGLMTYYFSSKEDLFDQTINRRLDELKARFSASMNNVVDNRDGKPSPFDISLGYIKFLFDTAYNEGPGWGNYMTLLAHAASFYDDDFVGAVLSQFHSIIDETIGFYRIAMPYADDAQTRKDFYYLEACVLATLLSTRFRTLRLQRNGDRVDLDTIARDMARFFSRGMVLNQDARAQVL